MSQTFYGELEHESKYWDRHQQVGTTELGGKIWRRKMTEHEKIVNGLKPLFEKAKKEGLWFNCHYQDLWFSPEELEERQAKGEFMWGAVNWTLKNPKGHLKSLERIAASAKKEAEE